jgi:hypothetical protein
LRMKNGEDGSVERSHSTSLLYCSS